MVLLFVLILFLQQRNRPVSALSAKEKVVKIAKIKIAVL